MSFWLLIRRSLRFHARNHFGVVLGAAIGSAALIGALIVGDSVRGSLRQHGLERLQSVEYAMNTADRFFQQDLASRLGQNNVEGRVNLGAATYATFKRFGYVRAAALQLPGTVSRQDGRARANAVNVLGIDLASWSMLARGGRGTQPDGQPSGAREQRAAIEAGLTPEELKSWQVGELVLLNQALASQLGVSRGDEVIVRVRKPSQLAQDAVISPREGTSLALRLKAGPVLPGRLLGDFSLAASQSSAQNAFLPQEVLTAKLDLANRANLLLNGPVLSSRRATKWDTFRLRWGIWLSQKVHGGARALSFPQLESTAPTVEAIDFLTSRLRENWALEDAQLSVRTIEQPAAATGDEALPPQIELSSGRIFLESNVVAAALELRTRLLTNHSAVTEDTSADVAANGFITNGTEILTYLANLIRKDNRATPYSMVTAAGGEYVPAGMRDDEILISDWLADDLQAQPGDHLEVSYYIVDSASHLIERTNSFTVRAIVPLKGKYADRTLMPEFPGVAKAESTQDWDTGFPLVYKIREKDEAYWKRYRGTPKAFITLTAGQAMWASRFGSLTAIRYAAPPGSPAQIERELAYKNLRANLDPAGLGFRFQPVREQALRAADQSQDFGQLFIGFSFFLVVAALLLMSLLFHFSLEQRRSEVGMFLALGFKPRQVRRLLLGEGIILALAGGFLGAALGLAYSKAMLWGLTTIWRDAIGASTLHFYVSPISLLTGLFAGTIIAVLTLWLTLRKQARRPARELLAGEVPAGRSGNGRWARWIAAATGVGGLATIGYAIAARQMTDPEIFFEAGSLLLLAGLAWATHWLSGLQAKADPVDLTLASLGVRACVRRRGRSVATIALLASGCFVIVSIGVFRLDANEDALKRSSGTGGFSLIGQATLPVVQDLNSPSGRQFFGLSENDFNGVSFVPFRIHNGDEASCLNLNRAQHPRLLGVKPELLAGRFTFADVAKGLSLRQGWELLGVKDGSATSLQPGEVPAIGDANSVQWALGKSVGDTLDYTDEHGRNFKLRLVGTVANSILQGGLIIDESELVKRFPSESGYRFFLIDAPANAAPSIAATLSRALQDQGIELTPAVRRLDEFNAVQNTYLGTFQILGGLGLLLGSAGLGVVVLRNVLERRAELGLLLAVGFRKRTVQKLVLMEHGALLGLGLALGIVAAAVAVLPALLSPGRHLPYASLSLTLGSVLLNGLVWTWLATKAALRGNLLAALRNE